MDNANKDLTMLDAFRKAIELLDESFQASLSTEEQLQLYGLYKVVTEGPVLSQAPGLWNFKAYKKHQAWAQCSELSAHDAMREYVELIVSLAHRNSLHDLSDRCSELLQQVGAGISQDPLQDNSASLQENVPSCEMDAAHDIAASSGIVKTDFKKLITYSMSATTNNACSAEERGISRLIRSFFTDVLGVKPLRPRGQLDISNADLRFAMFQCLSTFSHVQEQRLCREYERKIVDQWKHALSTTKDGPPVQQGSPGVLVGLSVRSLFDLYLRVKQFPAGSEIIITPPINVPGMLQVMECHQLKVVGVDLPEEEVVAVDCDAIEAAITNKTAAILVVHVFGMITADTDDMKRIRAMAAKAKVDILEDCAEAFSGIASSCSSECYMGSPYADLTLFSFGMIKTCTSLGGGVAVIRNHENRKSLLESMARMHDSGLYDPQTNIQFLWKVCKAFFMNMIATSPFLYGVLFACLRAIGINFDRMVTSLLRGFLTGPGLIRQIRRKPPLALLALMHRRFCQSTPFARSVRNRVTQCQQLSNLLEEKRTRRQVRIPTPRTASKNFFWLYPVLVDDPDHAVHHLRRHGFDATRGATQLCCVLRQGDASCQRANRLMDSIVYLPLGKCSISGHRALSATCVDMVKMVQTLQTMSAQSETTKGHAGNASEGRHGSAQMMTNLLAIMGLVLLILLSPASRYIIFSGVQLSCCLITVAVFGAWLLRWSTGDYYLRSSMGIAKYSSLLNEQVYNRSMDSTAAAPGVLSAVKTLKIPSNINYTGKRSVLLTGGTGFVGSMLLRDLLVYRHTMKIERVVVLCRDKRGKSSRERIDQLLSDSMFSFLTLEERETFVEVVNGDTTQPNAGIDDDALEHICRRNNISHIFHCAAAISFTQSLSDAAIANISSSLNVQRLATRITKTKVQFVHISTAFVHGGLTGSFEKPLPEELFSLGRFDPQEIYQSMCSTQFYADKAMSELRFPNTYTFSKCVCEHILLLNDPSTIIIRPSIVAPAVEAPYEGWAGQSPSTLVAAACLYLSYQWNIWSFGTQKVPCIPVDVLSRYILAKTFQVDSCSTHRGTDDFSSDETSSEGSYEKIRGSPVPFSPLETGSDSISYQTHQIYTAAWDVESPRDSCFTWLDYAGAVTQVGSVLGHLSRPMAYIALLIATRLLPKASLSIAHFERLHLWCVQYPFKLLLSVGNLLGQDTTSMKRLIRFLDLPLLFYPFMNNDFYFRSDLVAPWEMSGERYCFQCVAAAHFFVTRAHTRDFKRSARRQDSGNVHEHAVMSFLQVAGSTHQRSSDFWWALTQPRGNFFVQFTGWILLKILRACFSEVTIDAVSFASTSKAIGSESSTWVILAPTHRSFFDFLLLSYVSFAVPELQINIPFIAAAGEFERLPFLGYFMQLLGAFFVCRGRTEIDPCLPETLSSIQRKCCSTGSAIEVFIEGTRSRDRRFVKPKTGVLRCLKETGGNYIIVPISISYERIPEQHVLAAEAAGGVHAGLRIGAVFSWIQEVVQGKIQLGKVHISACDPLEMPDERKCDWRRLVDKIQHKQEEKILVSDYHVKATGKLLRMKPHIVRQAFLTLGVKFFPGLGVETSPLHIPGDSSELLSLLLQASPLLSPLFRSSRPAWSSWLHRLPHRQLDDKFLSDQSVNLLYESLLQLFDAADLCVERAIIHLSEKGFPQPKPSHVLQASLRIDPTVPGVLLVGSINMKYPKQSLLNSTSGEFTTGVGRTIVDSEEALGFWGFHDSKFVVRADNMGIPFVTMDGSRYTLRNKRVTKLLPFMEAETNIKVDLLNEAFTDCGTELVCSKCMLTGEHISVLESIAAETSTAAKDRIRHGTGQCQEDIFAIRAGHTIRVPDIVVWPKSEDEVVAVIASAKRNGWCIIPFGGGTNVSQATRCPTVEEEPRPIISLDMRRMNRVRWIDEENGLAHIEAGITGRNLEEELGRRGYTMGHEPDSIEFSTLGGWIATKASGMKRKKYGNIEDIVKAVRVAGPGGLLQHGQSNEHAWGRESTGVDFRSFVFGSEGCLGVVTSAVVRIWPIAEVKDYDSMLLADFDEGLRFVREIAKLGAKLPVSIRLLDNEHFRLGLSLRPENGSQIAALVKSGVGAFVKWKGGFEQRRVVCATITYEGTAEEVREQKRAVERIGHRHGAARLGADVGKSGYEMTYMIAYLRDFAMTYHFLGESFETFAPWSKVADITQKTKNRICQEHASRCLPGKPFVGCRVTQLYHEGVCLYFYFCMNFEGVANANSVYSEIEHAARDEILSNGGSLSHHHGVGKQRATFLKELHSAPLQDALYSVKKGIDPDNIFGARNGPFFTSSK